MNGTLIHKVDKISLLCYEDFPLCCLTQGTKLIRLIKQALIESLNLYKLDFFQRLLNYGTCCVFATGAFSFFPFPQLYAALYYECISVQVININPSLLSEFLDSVNVMLW